MQLDDLYRRVIMDHYKNPRNRGKFEDEGVTIDLNNPTFSSAPFRPSSMISLLFCKIGQSVVAKLGCNNKVGLT